jgi:hypothetical protein
VHNSIIPKSTIRLSKVTVGRSQKRAILNYRPRLGERGLARFEVLGRDTDRDLIRSVARRLAEDTPEASELRATMSKSIAGKPPNEVMLATYLRRALAIAALCVLSCSAARANACLDAFTKYKRIVNAVDIWYISAYERTTGFSFASDVPRQPCKVMLPLYRERLRRQRAVLGADDAWRRACPTSLHLNLGDIDGVRVFPAQVVASKITAQIRRCEQDPGQTLATGATRIEAGRR